MCKSLKHIAMSLWLECWWHVVHIKFNALTKRNFSQIVQHCDSSPRLKSNLHSNCKVWKKNQCFWNCLAFMHNIKPAATSNPSNDLMFSVMLISFESYFRLVAHEIISLSSSGLKQFKAAVVLKLCVVNYCRNNVWLGRKS